MWDAITNSFPNFNGATGEVWEWISNFISYYNRHTITYYLLSYVFAIGKIAWTIDAGKETLGGLTVSENGQIALCETPIPPGTPYNTGPKKDSKIHVFDLKVNHNKDFHDTWKLIVKWFQIIALMLYG